MRLIERFESKVIKTKDCWIWIGAKSDSGYGSMGFSGRTEKAHRISYELYNGHITKNKVVMHKCDEKLCVNPKHLSLGTQQDNMNDMVKKGRKILVAARGSRNGNSKLTEEIVRDIKFGNGRPCDLVRRYNISKTNVFDIRKNKIWKHIRE